MSNSSLLSELITSLQCLPGVGPKSAQRAAFHLLERDRDGALKLSAMLARAMADIGHCQRCRTFSEHNLCVVCASSKRDVSLLCVVESPMDVASIEQTADYNGQYFVLMGHLSPIDGITPDKLGMQQLGQRLRQDEVKEIIIATGTTMEGEATAHYIKELAASTSVVVTRIAFGVPVGGELEYVDATTLSHAISSRRAY